MEKIKLVDLPNEILEIIMNKLDCKSQLQLKYSYKKNNYLQITNFNVPKFLSNKLTNEILQKYPEIKYLNLYDNKIVNDWEDPRMPTIKGLRRKGYTPESINDFCNRIGISLGISSKSVIDYSLLEECLRQDLENKAPRIMAVINPLKVNIVNILDDQIEYIDALNYPNLYDKSTKRKIVVGNIIYIEKDDFRITDSVKYYRLAPNKIVRLKYFGLIKCLNFKINEGGNPTELFVELLPKDFIPIKRIRGTINWVSDIDHTDIEIIKYTHLFPHKLDMNDNQDWKLQLNENSFEKIIIKTDNSIKKANHYDKFQFERIGYFSVDPSSKKTKIIMNMIVSLKENKEKNLI